MWTHAYERAFHGWDSKKGKMILGLFINLTSTNNIYIKTNLSEKIYFIYSFLNMKTIQTKIIHVVVMIFHMCTSMHV